MAITAAQFPVREPFADPQGLVREPWRIWLRNLLVTQQSQPILAAPAVTLTAQSAAIGTTAIPAGTLSAGLYRFSYYATVTTAAGVSSGLIVTASWTDHGIAQSRSSANMTGNTTATQQSEVWPVHLDASSPVSYSTTYASNPAGAMVYSLYVILETISA